MMLPRSSSDVNVVYRQACGVNLGDPDHRTPTTSMYSKTVIQSDYTNRNNVVLIPKYIITSHSLTVRFNK